jgi:photosystem II stability/assembly factor-like uncharacterized protein
MEIRAFYIYPLVAWVSLLYPCQGFADSAIWRYATSLVDAVSDITIDPANPETVYTAYGVVFKSTDGGKTWLEASSGLGGPDVHSLAIDPNMPSKLHAAVREKGEGIYRTTNQGGKWTRVDDGPQGEVKVLRSVNIPTGMDGIFLYAGTSTGLQRSPDCF